MTETVVTHEAPTRKPRKRKFTREQLILNLQWIAAEQGGENVGVKHINRKGTGLPSAQAYMTEFDSLNAAKIEAGLAIRGRGKPRKDGGKVSATGEAAVAILKAARVPMTPAQVAAQIAMNDLTDVTAKNPADAVRKALTRAGAVKTESGFTLA